MRFYRILIKLWHKGNKKNNRLHSVDTRKIKTYLDLYIDTGILPSQYVKDNDIGVLRFSNTLIL